MCLAPPVVLRLYRGARLRCGHVGRREVVVVRGWVAVRTRHARPRVRDECEGEPRSEAILKDVESSWSAAQVVYATRVCRSGVQQKRKAGGDIWMHGSFETGKEKGFWVISDGLLHVDGPYAPLMLYLTVFKPQQSALRPCPVQLEDSESESSRWLGFSLDFKASELRLSASRTVIISR